METGDSALVARIHHSIADGIALIGVMLSLTDLDANAAPDAEHPPQHLHIQDDTDSPDSLEISSGAGSINRSRMPRCRRSVCRATCG